LVLAALGLAEAVAADALAAAVGHARELIFAALGVTDAVAAELVLARDAVAAVLDRLSAAGLTSPVTAERVRRTGAIAGTRRRVLAERVALEIAAHTLGSAARAAAPAGAVGLDSRPATAGGDSHQREHTHP
jgi:hypothetical protein